MVDFISCSTEADLTEEFFHKLLLGAIDKATDHKELSRDSSEGEGNRWLAERQPHSDPQTTTLQNLHDAQSSIGPRFVSAVPNGGQQHSTWYTRQDQPQSVYEDQYHRTPGQLSRHSTLPQRPAELPNRAAMRSFTLESNQPATPWRPEF